MVLTRKASLLSFERNIVPFPHGPFEICHEDNMQKHFYEKVEPMGID